MFERLRAGACQARGSDVLARSSYVQFCVCVNFVGALLCTTYTFLNKKPQYFN